jgi:hypothetical protein
MTVKSSRKYLSAEGLFSTIHDEFKKVKLPQMPIPRTNPITLTDCLMSGLALFSLKYPSLLKFDEGKEENNIKHNLRTLFHVQQAPSDTYMRERCDEVTPEHLRKTYKKIFSHVQRGKGLEEFEYLDQHYLLPGDGTGFFASNTVHCENCCVKQYHKCHVKFLLKFPNNDKLDCGKDTYLLVKNKERPWKLYLNQKERLGEIDINTVIDLPGILLDKERKVLSPEEKIQAIAAINAYHETMHPEDPAGEQVTYYHNMFCAAIVHPDKKIVLPLAPEPIMKTDGATKNDCERHASKRLYTDTRREHPHLKFIVVEDSLASNVPHLSDLKALDMRYIVGAKPGDHKFLFNSVKELACTEYSHQTEDKTIHRYRYVNQVQLNHSHPDFKVNFLEYWETDKKGDVQHFSWVTDIMITNDNVYDIMRGGRTNWRIENNTFNTLKNQNYHFSHNFGHGYKNLSTVFGMLMMLAFLVDQVQELSCQMFKKARAKFKSRTSLWERMQGKFFNFLIKSWDDLFKAIIYGQESTLVINTC